MELKTKIGRLSLNNPFIAASGTCGYGDENYLPLKEYGAFVSKTVTPKPREGNKPPRVVETPAGIINSIGLQNIGLEAFKEKLPKFKKPTTFICSIGGEQEGDYLEMVFQLNNYGIIDAFELNLSCPNVFEGGKVIGSDALTVVYLVEEVLKITHKPLFVKLSPFTNGLEEILISLDKRVDGFVLFNTFPAMVIDKLTGKPVLGNFFGGLSGPAIYPIVLQKVYQHKNFELIASGGIVNFDIALQFLFAGAKALQIGTGHLWNPNLIFELKKGLTNFLKEKNIRRLEDLK